MPQLRYNCRESDATDMRPFLSSSVVILVLGSEAVCAYRNFGPTNVFWQNLSTTALRTKSRRPAIKHEQIHAQKVQVVTCMLYWEDGLRVRDIHFPGRLASFRVKNLHRRCCRRRGRRRQSMFPYVVVRDQEKAIRRDLVGLSSCSWRSYLGTEYACLFAEILLPVKSLQMPAILRTYHYYHLLVLPIPTSTCINLWISNVATRFGHNRVTKA
ncbi:hypothetical protein BJ166DRAFT_185490 [Pestalotiopsis sp. NC0098]|nr:hypothetical protein BJ166DRAFT_185490 [Pestalotiopsis sp. NC0098]